MERTGMSSIKASAGAGRFTTIKCYQGQLDRRLSQPKRLNKLTLTDKSLPRQVQLKGDRITNKRIPCKFTASSLQIRREIENRKKEKEMAKVAEVK